VGAVCRGGKSAALLAWFGAAAECKRWSPAPPASISAPRTTFCGRSKPRDFVGFDEATRKLFGQPAYSRTRLWRVASQRADGSGAAVDARDLRCARRVGLFVEVLGPSSLLLLDWVGVAFRTDLYVTVGRPSPVPAGASGVIMAAFGSSSEPELEALFSKVAWYQKPSFADFLARVRRSEKMRFAVDSRRDVFRELRWSPSRFCRRHGSCC